MWSSEAPMEHIRTRHAAGAVVCAAFLILFAAGCGYKPSGSAVPDRMDISGLALSIVGSTSSSPGFEAEFTRTIRREFISFSGIPLMTEADAPYILECSVREINTRPVHYSSTKSVLHGRESVFWRTAAREMSIGVEARLIERATGNVLWHDSSIVETATWNLGADPLADREAERAAVRQIAERIASQLYSRTVARF